MIFLDQIERAKSYRNVLESSKGTIFISGISMSGLLGRSKNILQEKLREGHEVKILLMDESFAVNNKNIIEFNPTISEEIQKSLEILNSMVCANLEVKLYDTFIPIIVTGYHSANKSGNLVYEIVDYLSDSKAPMSKVSESFQPTEFETIRRKFAFYWSNAKEAQFD